MKVFAFDRDHTVDVNPPYEKGAVPLAWVRHLAHETEHAVWATGNQLLTEEADIPGTEEAVERHPSEDVPGRPPPVRYSRAERVRMVGELFPDAEEYIVIDDVNLGHLDGWTHYYPWEFVEAVESGELDIPLPER